MIPFVVSREELAILRKRIEALRDEKLKAAKIDLNCQIGTMIEIPRAALLANEIAHSADFFSFGTNDLTQTACGLSRDDSHSFLPAYVSQKIFPKDPFVQVDRSGVGELVRMGATQGRKTNPSLKVGVCGEHGGDPTSITLFRECGLNYVSCSPYRVPLARLAAAQCELTEN